MSDWRLPPAGSMVYLRLHPQSSRMCGATTGPARMCGATTGPALFMGRWGQTWRLPWKVVGLTPEGMPTAIETYQHPCVSLYVARLGHPKTGRLLVDAPCECHQNGIRVLVHPSEVCGVLDQAKPRETADLRRWIDTLPHWGGGDQ